MNMVSSRSTSGTDKDVASLVISPLGLLKFLSIPIALFGVLHMATLPIFLMGEEAVRKMDGSGVGLLNLMNERSLGAWFTVVVMGFNVALLILNGTAMRRLGLGKATAWLCLAVIFAYLSLDEMYALHERIGGAIGRYFGLGSVMTYPWVVTGLVFTTVVGLSFVRFLYRLPRRTAKLFIIAGAIYVGGAVGMEIIEGITATHIGIGTLYYTEVLFEECMEMFGQAFFAYALLDHLAQRRVNIRLSTN